MMEMDTDTGREALLGGGGCRWVLSFSRPRRNTSGVEITWKKRSVTLSLQYYIKITYKKKELNVLR